MCDPVTIAVVGVALNTVEQQQQAEQEQSYEQALYGQRKEAALDAFAQLDAREQQERAAAAADIQRVTAQARQAAGAAKLQALEGGARGRSVDVLLQTFENDRLAAVGAVQQNLDYTAQQLQAERRNAARIPPPRKVSGPLDSPFGIFGSLLKATAAGMEAAPAPAPAPAK